MTTHDTLLKTSAYVEIAGPASCNLGIPDCSSDWRDRVVFARVASVSKKPNDCRRGSTRRPWPPSGDTRPIPPPSTGRKGATTVLALRFSGRDARAYSRRMWASSYTAVEMSILNEMWALRDEFLPAQEPKAAHLRWPQPAMPNHLYARHVGQDLTNLSGMLHGWSRTQVSPSASGCAN